MAAAFGPLLLATSGCRIRSTHERREPSASAPAASVSGAASARPPGDPDPLALVDAGATAEASAPAGPVALVAVAGIGTSPGEVASVTAALERAEQALDSGASCLDAAVAGVAVLEDDPALNAGIGSALRLDGSVELDAAVMTSAGQFGSVTGLTNVRHPSEVARAVADTPHHTLAGAGALRFARLLGVDTFEVRTEASTARYKALLAELQAPDGGAPEPGVVAWPNAGVAGAPAVWQAYVPRRVPHAPSAPRPAAPTALPAPRASTPATSAPRPPPLPRAPAPVGGDTVAVLARCAGGTFVGVVSGGGPWLSLPGRVGDVSVPGAALYVGSAGAVFVSGSGEPILERLLARGVYDQLVRTGSPKDALDWALKDTPKGELSVTIVDAHSVTVAPDGATAWAAKDRELRSSQEQAP